MAVWIREEFRADRVERGRPAKNTFALTFYSAMGFFMNVVLPLDKMSVDEKLKLMEEIWADLSRTPNDIPVPQWHLDILGAREQRVQEGTEHYANWETAKKQIDEAIARGRPNED